MVFALVPNSRAKAVLKDMTDLVRICHHCSPQPPLPSAHELTLAKQSLFAKQVSWPELNQWFTVIAESEDAASLVLTKQISSSIAKYHKLVRFIHISDQFPHVT
jgi:hypothetical protein